MDHTVQSNLMLLPKWQVVETGHFDLKWYTAGGIPAQNLLHSQGSTSSKIKISVINVLVGFHVYNRLFEQAVCARPCAVLPLGEDVDTSLNCYNTV